MGLRPVCMFKYRVCARKYFSFVTSFANLNYFVPFSKSLSHILAIFLQKHMLKIIFFFFSLVGGRTGLVVRASDSGSGDPGSILCLVGVFVSFPKKVLVIPRNRWLRLNMTEKLFTRTLNHNQNNNKKNSLVICLLLKTS